MLINERYSEHPRVSKTIQELSVIHPILTPKSAVRRLESDTYAPFRRRPYRDTAISAPNAVLRINKIRQNVSA
jgi:hypothetical protein